ncbi:MAG TPA: hypothetical protein VLH94_04510 [Spirochaetia bacterium]|nr:hypothetical protein [Spirochaetia bacterium]
MVADNLKETPVQFFNRKMECVQKMLREYGKLLASAELEKFQHRFDEVTEELSYEQINQQEVLVLFYEVSGRITEARISEIREKVHAQVQFWTEKYGAEFTMTGVGVESSTWLEGVSSGNYRVVVDWINAGKRLSVQLQTPWGNCQCGKALVPRKIYDGTIRVYKKCPNCHYAESDIKNALKEATRGNVVPGRKVAKPGSAARRSKCPKPAPKPAAPVSAEEPKKEKKKGTKK